MSLNKCLLFTLSCLWKVEQKHVDHRVKMSFEKMASWWDIIRVTWLLGLRRYCCMRRATSVLLARFIACLEW